MRFARIVYSIAAVYGLLVTFPLFFMERLVGEQDPPPMTHAEYYYAFISIAVLWQIIFIFIARDPVRYHPLMIFTVFEKMTLLPGFFVLFPQHRYPSSWIALGGLDLFFGLLFAVSWMKTGRRSAVDSSGSSAPSSGGR
ncbi:MAG TPA: hypothetical protein VMW43_03375 [Bacteroidota bacterium]|nr:hypothetical protein [Bacteroidota bacterium]